MRLDKYLSEHGFSSRTKAARALEKGLVTVNGKIGKASQEVSETDEIIVLHEETNFVSEGGFKLYKALRDFGESVRDRVCIDLGASTGGFTDCLLQSGAAYVYAVDVGQSQLDESIAKNEQVFVMDRTNARYLTSEDFPKQIDILTADLSFISLTYILPIISRIVCDGGKAFVLVKPQFECGKTGQDKHGIVKDEKVRESVLRKIYAAATDNGLMPLRLTNAPIKPRKNIEYVLLLQKGGKSVPFEQLYREALDFMNR